MRDIIQSVDRALHLLEQAAREEGWIGLRELARRCELKVPTAQKLLKTMAHRGFLEFSPEYRKYRLGYKFFLMAEGFDPALVWRELVIPSVDRLSALFNETVVATVFQGHVLRSIEWRPSKHALSVNLPVDRFPFPHQLASGQALLACLSEVQMTHYLERQKWSESPTNCPSSPEALEAELERGRKRGWFRVADVGGSGTVAWAVPVCDTEGSGVLALGCSMPLTRCGDDLEQAVITNLQEEAGLLSRRIAQSMS